MPSKTASCSHHSLLFSPSSNAQKAGFKQHTQAQRIAATTPEGTLLDSYNKRKDNSAATFPAPLVLPGDDLSWDPNSPAQSLRSWIRGDFRNAVTPERRTVYFAAPPDFGPGLQFAQGWATPTVTGKEKRVPFPKTEEVLEYLQAFYHGVPVKMLPGPKLCFTSDIDEDDSVVDTTPPSKRPKTRTKPVAVKAPRLWLNTQTEAGCIGIRTRATPNGAYSHQLNLNDLLDAAMEILPQDAYALLMLVEHDIYEDEEDDFACGRAYGGSRIAVVSGARYDPSLDQEQKVPRSHAWPASHCQDYMEACVKEAEDEEGVKQSRRKKQNKVLNDNIEMGDGIITPMQAALSAHMSLPSPDIKPSVAILSGLWLGRVCRTGSHELGHCFGIGHCPYYACAMQGTASIIEDARQPPYLCPVDLAKILRATGADEKERYGKLLVFCEKRKEAHLFQAFGAWIRRRIEELEL